MTKLTVSLRDAIVDKAVEKAGINRAYKEYSEERKQWACAVADESLGGAAEVAKLNEANKKIAQIVKSLPDHLQENLHAGPLTGSIMVSFAGKRAYVREWDGERPAKGGLILSADHPLTVQFEQLENKERQLSEKKSNLRAEVRAVLNSVTTINRLLAVWPEAKELIPAQAARVNLPSVNVESLNSAIGLPSDQA